MQTVARVIVDILSLNGKPRRRGVESREITFQRMANISVQVAEGRGRSEGP